MKPQVKYTHNPKGNTTMKKIASMLFVAMSLSACATTQPKTADDQVKACKSIAGEYRKSWSGRKTCVSGAALALEAGQLEGFAQAQREGRPVVGSNY